MGIFDSAKDKMKDLAGDHEDQVDQGLDKVGDVADDKTGGKYSDQIDQGKDKAGDYLGGDNEDNNN
ncbi:MAG TPA: antitoxin [Mycobacteriales bacterium]|nr:antitoxin [Mycobacteriales bacterium]